MESTTYPAGTLSVTVTCTGPVLSAWFVSISHRVSARLTVPLCAGENGAPGWLYLKPAEAPNRQTETCVIGPIDVDTPKVGAVGERLPLSQPARTMAEMPA